MAPTSAGILLYRLSAGRPEVLLAHPGGPFWARRDAGAWTIPKGAQEEGETAEAAARREFAEETGTTITTPLALLGTVRQRAGKIVTGFAAMGDLDPSSLASTTVSAEWPPRSGRILNFPEIDRIAWFDLETARMKINPAQAAFLDRLPHVVDPTAQAGAPR